MALLWLADALREAGITVVEYSGWKTHARSGAWTPTYGVVHATAAPRTQKDSIQVDVVRNGRSDLPGPIANAVVRRDGVWVVVSAGRCNSTLTGTAGPYRGLGNTHALSVEGCNDNRSEPWPEVQYRSYVRGWAAWCQRLGWSADRLVGHKEHTPGHKSDPTFDMGKFRRDVAALLSGKDAAGNNKESDMFQTLDAARLNAATERANGIAGMKDIKWTDPRDGTVKQEPNHLAATLLRIETAVNRLADQDPVDEQAIVNGVLAGLGTRPEEMAEVLRAVLGEDRAAELGRLLTGGAS